MLKFSEANTKTKQLKTIIPHMRGKVYSFDLPAGYACPGAKDCHSRAVLDPTTGKTTIKDSPTCQFRCFSASQEALFPKTYRARQHNLSRLRGKSIDEMATAILAALPPNAGIIRLHVAGDFFSLNYLKAWIMVAGLRPNIIFYCYTKSLHFIQSIIPQIGVGYDLSRGKLLDNFRVVASRGGKYDCLIGKLGIRTAKVVYSEDETTLPIDHTDENALQLGGSFALMIHGMMPANSPAMKAVTKLRQLHKLDKMKS